ncbi:MAG: hypothetical protein IBJ11_03940 [Phycisphaerales bacterium]|nr:hypothetical protein [Phycisphaerales bacterium]
MITPLDAVYAVVAAATSPWWLRKARSDWGERFGRVERLPAPAAGVGRVLVHAVSVGEVNAARPLVERLAGEAGIEVVVTASTDTGLARAGEVFRAVRGVRAVARYPLDASWSVRRFLDAVRPTAVALMELELWPTFVRECGRRGVPVAVVNGRLSERSFKRYRLGRGLLSRTFGSLAFAAVQDRAYAERFIAMGVPADRCTVAGSMKWDAAHVGHTVPGAEELARDLGIDRSRPLVVAGSTAPGEPELLHRSVPEGVQLLCAPRKPEWFGEAFAVLGGPDRCVRRSGPPPRATRPADRFLLDTIGELRKAYALADVVVIGRSFGTLFGSDPMEVAALGKPALIGPRTADFEQSVGAIADAGGLVRTAAESLAHDLAALLADAPRRSRMGEAARACVLAHRGAADRQSRMLADLVRSAVGAPAETVA